MDFFEGRGPRSMSLGHDGFPQDNPQPRLPGGLPQLSEHAENRCPECEVPYTDTDLRRVIDDACKHHKCRKCMIDNDPCHQCVAPKRAAMSGPPHLIPQVPVPEARSAQEGPRRRSLLTESSTSGKASATNVTFATSINDALERSSSAADLSGSPAKNRPKLTPNRSPRRALTDGINPPKATIDVKQMSIVDPEARPSTSTSPQQPLYAENSESSIIVVGTEGLNADDNDNQPGTSTQPDIMKKKRRSRITIPDCVTVLEGDPPQYQCNVCMRKFKTKLNVKYHEFCQKGEKPFKCAQCGRSFISKSHYQYHLRTHTGERPFVCPKCGKGFNQRGKLTRHIMSHTGEKPFICQQCGRGFTSDQAKKLHLITHTDERPHACQECDKKFSCISNLKKHMRTHTGEKPFQCNLCGKCFALKWTLDLHLKTHSRERPYACEQCSRAFSIEKDLERHMKNHSGEKPFKCMICGTVFRRKDNLDRHIKSTHNQPKEVAKQLANEAAAEYMAKQNEAKAAAAAAPKKPNILGFKVNKNGPSTSKAGGKFRSLADYVPPASEEGVVITADISPTPSPAPKEEIQGQSGDQINEDPLDLHQPAAEDSDDNGNTPQTFSIVVTADGKFIREANDASNQDITPQIVNVCSIASSESKSAATLTDDDGPQTCEKGIQCFPSQDNFGHGTSEPRRRSYQIPAQEVILTNGNGQTVHQILSPMPAYYQVPENNDRRVVYVIQHPHTAPYQQETGMYTNWNAVATQVIPESHVRYATTSQAPTRILDDATGNTFDSINRQPSSSSAMAQPGAQTAHFRPQVMNLFRPNLNGTVSRVETVSRSSNPSDTVVLSSQREIRNHHNYATSNEMPAVVLAERYTRSPQYVLVKAGDGSWIQVEQAIATTRQMQDSDFQRPAQNGQESRHNEESIPHRGHWNQYLASQPPK